MSDIEVVNEDYDLANPLDDGGSDDNDIAPSHIRNKGKKKTQKVFMKDVIQGVLSKKIKKDNPILSKYKFPMKKTKQEIEDRKKERHEKLKRDERKNRGHYIPQYELDRARENKLKATAMKGVVKLFNAIHEYQKNNPNPEY